MIFIISKALFVLKIFKIFVLIFFGNVGKWFNEEIKVNFISVNFEITFNLLIKPFYHSTKKVKTKI